MTTEALSFSRDPGEQTLRACLRTRLLGRSLMWLASCDSTNEVARRLIEDAVAAGRPLPPNGTLVIADSQTAGRGRAGKAWSAPSGTSLLFSLILYPSPSAPGGPQPVTMAAALSVVRALGAAGAGGCSIKWPNDVLGPDGRKICGILTERVDPPGRPTAFVTGIGVNVNQTGEDFGEGIRGIATSAREIAGGAVAREDLLGGILVEFESCLQMPDEALFTAWRRYCTTLGQTVRVRLAGREIVGLALGVEPDGALIVRLGSGIHEVIRSGDVEELRVAQG